MVVAPASGRLGKPSEDQTFKGEKPILRTKPQSAQTLYRGKVWRPAKAVSHPLLEACFTNKEQPERQNRWNR